MAKIHSGFNDLNIILNEFFEKTSDVFLVVDESWNISYVNSRIKQYSGINKEDMEHKFLWDVFPEFISTIEHYSCIEAMKKRMEIKFEAYSKKRSLWLEVNIYPISTGGLMASIKDVSAYKDVKTALNESEEKLKVLVDYKAQAVWEGDLSGIVSITNSMSEGYFKNFSEKYLGYKWLDLVHDDDRNYVEKEFKKSMSEGKSFSMEFRYINLKGEVKWTNMFANPIWIYKDKKLKWSGMNIDISKRKKAEKELQKREETQTFLLKFEDTLRDISSSSEIQNVAAKMLGEKLNLNRVLYTGLSKDLSEIIIQKYYCKDLDSVEGSYDALQFGDIYKSPLNYEKTLICDDVQTNPLVTPTEKKTYEYYGIRSIVVVPFVKNGKLTAMLSVHDNIPRKWTYLEVFMIKEAANRTWAAIERSNGQKAIKKSESKYKMLFESIDEGFCIIKVIFDSKSNPIDYKFIETNPAFEKHAGIKDVEGKLFSEFSIKLDKGWLEVYGKVALTGEPIRTIADATYLKRWISAYAFKIDSEDNSNVAVLFKDVTEDIKAKNELKKSLKIQDEVFANISHELKTPLNVIFSTNQLMNYYIKNDKVDKERFGRCIDVIRQNCYRFTKLINNIVDMSKIDSGFYKVNISNENIVELVENIVQSVAEYIKEKELAIIFDTEIEEKLIACDPEKIERIILNLISNAIKFSNPGNEIAVLVSDKGEYVEISVKDQGVGIEERYLDSIFKRYHQVDKTLARNTEGSGIGLSLVKSIVDLHHGRVWVDSEVGKGSIFKVELPVRVIEESRAIHKVKAINNKVEMINVEFADIYS